MRMLPCPPTHRSAVPSVAYVLKQIPEELWLQKHKALKDYHRWGVPQARATQAAVPCLGELRLLATLAPSPG